MPQPKLHTPMQADDLTHDLTQALAQEAQRQQALMAAIHASPQADDAPGLRAHRGHLKVVSGQVLNNAYPKVANLVGQDTLAQLAWPMWQQHPPTSGDLGEWGHALPDLLTNLVTHDADWQTWACLPDLARIEWACQTCERAGEQAPDLGSLQLLGNADPQDITIDLQNGLEVLTSPWAWAEMWPALSDADPDPQRLQALMRVPEAPAHAVVVSRPPQGHASGASPWLARITPLPEAMRDWMQALKQAHPPSLQTLLDRQSPDFDFTAWLTLALQEGWLWRVRALRSPEA